MNSNNNQQKRLRIGIVGCGRVAEYHARFIKGLSHAQMVAIADINQVAARQFAEAHGIATVCATLDELLNTIELDVLHVITPPAYHYECARAALERGVHVFIEKPIAFTAREVSDLYDRAAARGLSLCPDFLQLFHPKMRELATAVESGQLGRVVHVESYLHIDLNQSPELLEAEGIHWSYRLPGGLLRDYSSHLLYMALYFAGSPNNIHVSRNSRGSLPHGLVDHLTVHVDGAQSTATILLTCLARPSAYGVRVFCEKGSAEINFETQTLLISRESSLPRRIVSATANFTQSCRLSWQGINTIVNYLRGSLVPYAGMQALLPLFYDSILNSKMPPISRELATAVVWAEEEIFSGSTQPSFQGRCAKSQQTEIRQAERVLVTGANGYVGSRVVKALVERGYYVRALVRPTGSPEKLERLGVEVFLGDVRRVEDVNNAAEGMQIIVHMAAGMKGTHEFMVDSCVRGTQSVAEAASLQGVKRVIYMSSLSVYDYAGQRNGTEFTETTPLEAHAETRGAYSLGKRRAEDIALSHLADNATPWTVLRPSLIVGNGSDICAPVGSKIGNNVVCLGSPRKRLPLVHVDDVAAAVLQVLQNPNTRGQVYVLSDPDTITVRTYVKSCLRSRFRDLRIIHVPYVVMRAAGLVAALVKKVTGFGPTINRRRLLSVYRDIGASSALLQRHTGWQPAGALLERLNQEADGIQVDRAASIPRFWRADAGKAGEATPAHRLI
jgi:predicted dehydrogenase/nucleoside-diphosphate-sugar epimerase